MDLQVKQSLYDEVLRGHVANLPEAFSDPRTIEIQKQINLLSVTAAQLSVSYGPDNPHLQEVQQQISKLEEQVGSSRKELAAKIRSDYERAETDYKFMASAVEQAKSEAAQQDQASIQYNILKQDVDTARSLYNEFLQKTNQANLEEAQQQQNNVDIIRPARIPKAPDGPTKGLLLVLGPIAGVLAGVGIAVAVEQFDKTIRTSEDVAEFAQLPMLGAIPSIPTVKARLLGKVRSHDHRPARFLEPPSANGKAEVNPELAKRGFSGFLPYASGSSTLSSAFEAAGLDHLKAGRHSGTAESYRTLRTSLLLTARESQPKTMLFTSGLPGEGKTTTIINTAIAFALQGASVLILDADLRKPPISSGNEIELGQGLSDYLAGDMAADGLIRKLRIENLSLLPSGSTPDNPSELLGSNRMRSLLADLTGSYNYIIIDSPPVMYVTDPVILSTMVDAVVIVAQWGKTTRDVVRQTREMLLSVGANVLGIVLNNIDTRRQSYRDFGPYAYYSRHDLGSPQRKASDIVN
jgi:capsular exopolysaccharide synthesis family protein